MRRAFQVLIIAKTIIALKKRSSRRASLSTSGYGKVQLSQMGTQVYQKCQEAVFPIWIIMVQEVLIHSRGMMQMRRLMITHPQEKLESHIILVYQQLRTCLSWKTNHSLLSITQVPTHPRASAKSSINLESITLAAIIRYLSLSLILRQVPLESNYSRYLSNTSQGKISKVYPYAPIISPRLEAIVII